ncbi:MAG: SDR family oxidoreductase [Chloroflexi bacterium]|nr:SDR family oxidoreductase [Chloroflexota bacterium]
MKDPLVLEQRDVTKTIMAILALACRSAYNLTLVRDAIEATPALRSQISANPERSSDRLALENLIHHVTEQASLYSAPLMEPEGGSVLTLTFLASGRVFPGYNVMGVAKAALENEVRQLAAEYGPRNIRVNAISAGALDTLSSRVISGYRDMKRITQERAPLGRNITHDEVAKTALYLCSDLSSGVTGAVIPVDAGFNIMGI